MRNEERVEEIFAQHGINLTVYGTFYSCRQISAIELIDEIYLKLSRQELLDIFDEIEKSETEA